jgi:hypothetical protein
MLFGPLGLLFTGWMLFGLIVLAVWEAIWKGFGLWYSAKNQQKEWFVCILIFNTLGLLPIIYLLWFKPEEKKVRNAKPSKKRK